MKRGISRVVSIENYLTQNNLNINQTNIVMKKKLHQSLYLLIGIMILSSTTYVKAQQEKRSEGRPVAASSVESSSYVASNAVDGSLSTVWSSLGDNYNQWFDVDLGKQYDVSRVIIHWADGRYATYLDIQVRNTTSEPWVTIRTISGNTSSTVNDIRGLKSNSRFVRFNGRGRANPAGYRIAELEVYGYPTATEPQQDIDTLTNRLKKLHIDEIVGSSDDVPADSITSYMSKIDSTGKMNDINYGPDGNWRTHVSRMKLMAVAYRNPASPHYNSGALCNKIRLGLYYYYEHSPYTYSPNWWYVKIGAPNAYMAAIILMKGAIQIDSLRACASAIIDYTGEPDYKGQNRTWVSMAPIHRGCIEDRSYWINKGYASMVTALDIATGADDEGIKIDNSFHQHHAQIQSGSYGKAMLQDQIDYMRVADGTQFDSVYDNNRRQTVTNVMLKGLQLLSYKNQVDFGVVGRGLAGYNGTINIKTLSLDKMKLNQPDSASAYDSWKNHILGLADYPAYYRGATHFWKSDILSYRGANYYLSAKIISSRTYGTEMLNGENLKGYNLPMGATNIMSTGDEYRNIFPVWDWSRVPGTTAEWSEAATVPDSSYIRGTNLFGGGISHGDDGVLAYEHNYKGITAKKSYFFMENMMLCLGAGITGTKSNPVITSIDQTTLVGDVTFNRGGSDEILGTTPVTYDGFKWVQHNNIGYIFPLAGNMTIQKATQSGSWHDIKNSGSTTTQNRDIFSAWFNHSSTPSNRHYCYIVAPGKSVSDMPTLFTSHGFVIVQNNTSIQAIRNDLHKKWAVVFYSPGTVDMGNGMTITSDKKAIVLIKEYSGNYRISVSDPLYSQSSVAIKINKQVEGGTYANGFTTLNITFPSGDLTGSTKTGFYNKIQSNSLSFSSEKENKLDNHIVIYPNPTTDLINISGLSKGAIIEIYDTNGRRLITTTKSQISINHLVAGNYVIRINDHGAISNHKIIKQ